MLCSFSLKFIFFSEQLFYGNYSTLDSHTNTVISHAFAYSSRWRRKPWQSLLHSFNIQNRTKHAWAFSKTVQKISKITYTASRFSLWQAPNFQWTLKELRFNMIKNLLCLFFLLNGFITMCNLKKRLIRAAFWVLCGKRCLWTTENKRQSD